MNFDDFSRSNKKLFNYINYENNPHWPVLAFFNSMYSQKNFIPALEYIANRISYVYDYDRCIFPDFEDGDPSGHFEGVEFSIMNDRVVISDTEFLDYIGKACQAYIAENPMHRQEIEAILLKGVNSAKN
jgi:hypothetical protein